MNTCLKIRLYRFEIGLYKFVIGLYNIKLLCLYLIDDIISQFVVKINRVVKK